MKGREGRLLLSLSSVIRYERIGVHECYREPLRFAGIGNHEDVELFSWIWLRATQLGCTPSRHGIHGLFVATGFTPETLIWKPKVTLAKAHKDLAGSVGRLALKLRHRGHGFLAFDAVRRSDHGASVVVGILDEV